jgi:hypothetical protein
MVSAKIKDSDPHVARLLTATTSSYDSKLM